MCRLSISKFCSLILFLALMGNSLGLASTVSNPGWGIMNPYVPGVYSGEDYYDAGVSSMILDKAGNLYMAGATSY
jgi:hypothetical protein